MTWHTFFALPFGSYRHNLFIGYAAVWTIQAAYFAWLTVNWRHAGRRSR